MPIEVHVGDIARLRKPHPCGGTDWEVYRIGADIGLRCLTCARRVMYPRRRFEHSLKTFLKRGWTPEVEEQDGPEGES